MKTMRWGSKMMIQYKWLAFSSLLVLATIGCGGSSSTPDVVTPPAPQGETSAPEAPPSEPPGTMEMPAGVTPENVTPAEEAKPGGFELPKDIPLPAADQTTADNSIEVEEAAAPEIKFASWGDIEKAAKSTGKITVVDVWSLSCAPCLKEFPGLVRLDNEYPGQLACIGVDVDFDGRKTRPPESYEERVTGFLKAVKADFANYICTTPSDDVFSTLEIDSIPTVLIYGADGELKKKFVDAGETLGFTYEKDVRPYLQTLMQ